MQASETQPLTLDVTEVAKLLGIDRKSVYNAIQAGEIPAVRIGRRLLVPRAFTEKLKAGEVTFGASATQPRG